MKIKIRRGLFETNSSSVHSICICNTGKKEVFPTETTLSRGKYGWENNVLNDFFDKADYFFEMCLWEDFIDNRLTLGEEDELGDIPIWGYSNNGCIMRFVDWLEEKGVKVKFKGGKLDDGYIDHYDMWGDDAQTILDDKQLLEDLLLNPLSIIITTNDNTTHPIKYVETDYCKTFDKYN